MTTEILYTHDGKPLFTKEEGLVTGDLPCVLVPKKDISLKWNGSLIPSKLLRQTVNFSKYVFLKYGGECQWRLAYNEASKKWAVIVLKQYISQGLESDEVGADGDMQEALKQLDGDGWTINGTGHSHCNASAFMSGTDKADEQNQTGFHYTVGHLEHGKYDLHSRYSFRGLLYEYADAETLFAKPNRSMKRLPRFPEAWKDCLVEPPKRQYGFTTGRSLNVSKGTSKVQSYNPSSHTWKPTYNERPKITDEQYDVVMGLLGNHHPDAEEGDIVQALQQIAWQRKWRPKSGAYCPFCGGATSEEGVPCDDCVNYYDSYH